MWCYPPGGKGPKYGFHRKQDTILFYRKSSVSVFNRPFRDLTEYQISKFTKVDSDGRRYKEYRGTSKTYLDEMKGSPVPSWWTDIHSLGQTISKERMGYPTQKPVRLLERIIKASSNKGDIVLDPFCGCGTTVEAAKSLDRQFIGIDISSFAIDLVRDKRLKDSSLPVYGIPYDLRSAEKLAGEKPFDFESWAITRLPGFVPNTKQVADGGIDGRAYLAETPKDLQSKLALAQVKGGKFSLSGLRDFIGVTKRDQAALGCYVTLRPVRTKSAKMEMISTGKIQVGISSYPRMQIWSIKDYFDDRLPRLPTMNDPYTGKAMLPQLFL